MTNHERVTHAHGPRPGRAPGLNSGAAAMVVASESRPFPAVRKTLQLAGWSIRDLERVEINEAFAAVALACIRELGLPEDVVNVEGGAIAHGHPIGATGAVLTTRLRAGRIVV